MIKWVQDGSRRDQWDEKISAIVHENCVKCHGTVPGLASFVEYDGITKYTEIDQGATVSALTRVSHIHLFGIAFIFFFVCLIFNFTTGIPVVAKSIIIGSPFAFLIIDIFSWWLIKWFPDFAWLTILAGTIYNIAAAFMILSSLYQMWVMPFLKRQTH